MRPTSATQPIKPKSTVGENNVGPQNGSNDRVRSPRPMAEACLMNVFATTPWLPRENGDPKSPRGRPPRWSCTGRGSRLTLEHKTPPIAGAPCNQTPGGARLQRANRLGALRVRRVGREPVHDRPVEIDPRAMAKAARSISKPTRSLEANTPGDLGGKVPKRGDIVALTCAICAV